MRRDDGKSVDRVSGGGGSKGVCTTWSVNAVCGGGSVNIQLECAVAAAVV